MDLDIPQGATMTTSICFTRGHISIRRGRTVRQYADATSASRNRCAALVADADIYPHSRVILCDPPIITQSSVTYRWHGRRSLTRTQLALVRAYDQAIIDNKIDYDLISDDYMYGYISAWQDTFRALHIHPYHLHM